MFSSAGAPSGATKPLESRQSRSCRLMSRRFATASMEKKTEKRSVGREIFRQSVSFEMSVWESGQFGNVLENGSGVDISNGGIGLIMECPLEECDVLKLYFPIAAANTSLPVYTEVMWATPIQGKFRAGLRFLA